MQNYIDHALESFRHIRCETIEVDTLFKVNLISLIYDYSADAGIA